MSEYADDDLNSTRDYIAARTSYRLEHDGRVSRSKHPRDRQVLVHIEPLQVEPRGRGIGGFEVEPREIVNGFKVEILGDDNAVVVHLPGHEQSSRITVTLTVGDHS